MSARDPKSRMSIKVYLVILRLNLAAPGMPNRKVIDACLTQSAAQAVVDRTPGTYIEKIRATKTTSCATGCTGHS